MALEEGKGANVQRTITIPIEFYRGVKAIANFLELHPDTVREADP